MTVDTCANVLYTLIKVHVKDNIYNLAKDWKKKLFYFFRVNLKYNDVYISSFCNRVSQLPTG